VERPCRHRDLQLEQRPIAASEAWERADVFQEIWRRKLLDNDAAVGIDWAWLAAAGAMTEAPPGGEGTGPNPTD